MKASLKSASLALAIVALGALLQTGAAAAPAITDPAAIPTPTENRATYLCIFAPQPGQCDAVYRKALHDASPEGSSVRDAYEHYARYLKGENTLTDVDRQYLKASQTSVPDDLSPMQTSGLHNVINDPALARTAGDRKAAVTNYLSRAEEANIYCGLESCGKGNTSSGISHTAKLRSGRAS